MAPRNRRNLLESGGQLNRRLDFAFVCLLILLLVFVTRLFYLQIVRHDYYQKQALSDQLKEYKIAPQRGTIKIDENGTPVPLVLNQMLYTLYADPGLVKDASSAALKLSGITGGNANDYAKLMKKSHTRYVVLAKRLNQDQKNKILGLKLAGVGAQGQDYRTYPQGTLAAQLLGFVDNDGVGRYGLEQAMNKQLAGTPGVLKAITDVSGVPLAASKDNIDIAPKNGDSLDLTLDLGMQKQLESLLAQNLKHSLSTSGSAIIMDPNTGAIKALANLPTYDPSQYYKVADANLFNNASVSEPLEVGSIMKTLTASAALDQGAVTLNSTYNDPGQWPLDGSVVKNVEEDGGPGPANVAKILNLSMNTGATWMLMQMGHTTGQVTKTARDKWHDYMVNHFQLGKPTGIEQGYEAGGYIPNPDSGYALQLTYANTAFGQAMTATPLQMAAALSSVINGGTYFQPRLIDKIVLPGGQEVTKQPVIVRRGVVSAKVAAEMRDLMVGVAQTKVSQGFSSMNFPAGYVVGGKTGTAQIADPAGGYYGDRFNGTFIGFVGGDKPQYVIMVSIKQPHIGGYAGSTAALPLFADLAHMLINNFNVQPKS